MPGMAMDQRVVASLIGLALLCFSPPLYAQEDGEESAVPQERTVYANGHIWIGAGLGASVRSLSTDAAGNIYVLASDGTVYRRPVGESWREGLGPTGLRLADEGAVDEEVLLLDAEGALLDAEDLTAEEDEAFGDDDDDSDDDEADEVEESERPVESAADSLEDVADVFDVDSRGDGSSVGPRAGRLIWASEFTAGVVLVAREDGLWRSEDGGESWRDVGGLPPVHVFSDAPGGLIIAGTTEGLRFSGDAGQSWSANVDPISGIEVFHFARDGKTLFAGTEEGLFRSRDGLKWAKLLSRYDSDVPVWAVAIDRYWSGGLWVSGPVGVLRSDDGGEQLRAAGRNVLPGTVSLLALDSPGHLLAAGIDGVWESRDGGMRWRPVVNGLPSAANFRLQMGSNGPVVGGLDGVFSLTVADVKSATEAPQAIETPDGADMASLVVVALNRPGMVMSDVLVRGSIARSLLLPKLTISSKWSQQRMMSADYGARSNRGHFRSSWDLGLTACFGACTSGSSFVSFTDDVVFDSGGSYAEVAVVGDEVYSAAGEGSLAPMAANVAERVTRYRTDVSGRITELVIARHRLLEAGGIVKALSLKAQITHELDLAESSARLDVYTNGYFTRVLEGS